VLEFLFWSIRISDLALQLPPNAERRVAFIATPTAQSLAGFFL